MSSCENVESTEVGSQGHQNHPPVMSNGNPKLNDNVEEVAVGEVEDEEDEEEDVDFNPFLKETPSPEASSSLSSEIEGLDTDVVDSRTNTRVVVDVTSSKIKTKVKNCDIVDADHGEEETVMQSTASPELQNTVPQKHNNWKPGSSSQAETEKESQLSSVNVGDSDNTSHSRKPVMHLDDVEEDAEDDAICRRTRARYSLASFSLDELEAFLQETDDEDDVHNVDDEEEYRKFLAAVLQGGDVDPQSTLENENGEDEDEENDADFEIELEDALGSDYDEATLEKTRAEEYQRTARRPETRQNRRLKASAQYERKLSEQTKRPLRPLLPILPNGMTPIPTVSGNTWMSEMYKSCLPSAAVGGFINGFTSYQIGQLHCLIYEHVQLLIQIYSLCVLDYSRRQIASQIQGLIFEMLHKRDETIACKNEPFPDTCFKPPCFSASVPNTQMVGAQKISSSTGSHVNVSNGQLFSSWLPVLSSPVLSVLDVAPLNLVGKYMEDVYSAVQEHHQRHLENACVTQDEKEPLFPFHCVPAAMEANNEALRGSAPPTSYAVPSSINQPKPKKTLAATLVEKTKKQSVAVVPKKISKLAQRFFPLFNPALFPHKPPPAAVANRVLFTDAEDELLALGLMEYNSDWKAIHQRFLPCKSKHQIFVRQKNRCSSKAPENPIKAVRRMKTSPLTVEEIQGIQEGLKVFKLDWMSVWKFIVPHRDPSLLPRQWRIALGTQKSYKQDEAKKEKRRLYESERRKRKRKAADLSNLQHASDKEEYRAEYTGGENCTGDDDINKGDESYVHEGFLADWRPGTSELKSSDRLSLNISEKNLPENIWTEEGAHVRDQSNSYVSTVIKPMTGHMQGSPLALNHSQHPYTSHFASNALRQTHPVPSMTVNSSKSQVNLRPYRSRKTSNLRLVKLAPDLPPVNLPPSVRVIPESALKTNQLGAYTKISPILHSTKSLTNTTDSSNPTSENVTNWCSEASRVVKDQSATEERSAQTDLQMHPLLFQAPEDGQVPYYRLNSGTGASSSFSFVTGNQPQLNLSLFYNPQQANHAIDGLTKTLKMKKSVSASCGIDFHPLLQRDDNTNSELVTANSTASHVSLDGKGAAPGISSTAVLVKSVIHCSPFATRSKPSGPNEKANGLDLEIHLSSSSTKENAALSTAMTRATNSSVSLLNSQNATETQDTSHTSTNNFVAGVHALSLPSKIIGRYMDDATDQTHPEIVMEQEELSDSDEEVEEHVEFECEEMADSEGEEGSDSEQVSEMQDKEALCLMTSKNVSDEDCNDDQCDLSTRGNSQTNICVLGRRSPPFLKLGLKCSKDKNSSWLSLDSSACGPISRSTSKNETSTMRKGPSAKVLASDRSNRPLKQATASTRKAAVKKHATDVAGQLSLSSLSVPTLRKPRKRTCRTNTIANAGSSLGNLNNNAKNSG